MLRAAEGKLWDLDKSEGVVCGLIQDTMAESPRRCSEWHLHTVNTSIFSERKPQKVSQGNLKKLLIDLRNGLSCLCGHFYLSVCHLGVDCKITRTRMGSCDVIFKNLKKNENMV